MRCNVPVIASGGMRQYRASYGRRARRADGIAIADALHWKRMTLGEIKGTPRLQDRLRRYDGVECPKDYPVTVLDYGIGNHLNVLRALEHAARRVKVVPSAPPAIDAARHGPARSWSIWRRHDGLRSLGLDDRSGEFVRPAGRARHLRRHAGDVRKQRRIWRDTGTWHCFPDGACRAHDGRVEQHIDPAYRLESTDQTASRGMRGRNLVGSVCEKQDRRFISCTHSPHSRSTTTTDWPIAIYGGHPHLRNGKARQHTPPPSFIPSAAALLACAC